MKTDLRFGWTFSVACLAGLYVHEIGHAVAAWLQGISAVPTPAKEYVLQTQLEWGQEVWISFGGVAATMLLTTATLLWYAYRPNRPAWSNAVLAGVLLPSVMYTVRFLIVGRGHDGLEWQGAQAAVGLDPAGHVVDNVLLCLCVAGVATGTIRGHVSLRPASIVRVVALALVGLAFLAIVQVTNNVLFDRFFPKTTTVHVPTGLPAK